jgi:hypothetical protein
MCLGLPSCPGPLINVALCAAASVSPLAWLPTYPWLACPILSTCSPQLHCLLIQTTREPPCSISRQKRKPQPPSGCQGGWQKKGQLHQASPGKQECVCVCVCVCVCACVCVERREGVKKLSKPPLLFLLRGNLPLHLSSLPPKTPAPSRFCWDWKVA